MVTIQLDKIMSSYEVLVRLFTDVDEYRLYYSQCLYKIGQLQASFKMSSSITSPDLLAKVCSLQSAIKFEMSDIAGCQTIMNGSPDNTDKLIDTASILFKVLSKQ